MIILRKKPRKKFYLIVMIDMGYFLKVMLHVPLIFTDNHTNKIYRFSQLTYVKGKKKTVLQNKSNVRENQHYQFLQSVVSSSFSLMISYPWSVSEFLFYFRFQVMQWKQCKISASPQNTISERCATVMRESNFTPPGQNFMPLLSK